MTPGLANKLALPFAQNIAFSFPETEKYINKNKSIYTGLPIRKALFSGDKEKGLNLSNFSGTKPIVLVVGGSQGSKYINDLIRKNLDELLDLYEICHICGKGQIDNSLINRVGYKQFQYVNEELKDLLIMSDLIISRAGATFIFEILALKKLNILIPLSKKASRGDQILNAQSFENSNFSKVIQEEGNINIFNLIAELLDNKKIYYQAMEKSDLTKSNENVINLIKKFI